jgi:hypothetical protein
MKRDKLQNQALTVSVPENVRSEHANENTLHLLCISQLLHPVPRQQLQLYCEFYEGNT